jgi:hypothetical protein
MEVPTRKTQVSPPFVRAYQRPVSTARAERHLAQAEEYRYQTHMFSSFFRFGGETLKVADRIFAAKEASDVANAQVDVENALTETWTEMQQLHYSEWKTLWEKRRPEIEERIIEGLDLPRSKEAFKEWYPRRADKFETDLGANILSKYQSQVKVDYVNDVQFWAELGKDFKVVELLETIRSTNLYTPEELDKIEKAAQETLNYGIASREVQRILQSPDGSLEAARGYMDSDKAPALSETSRNKLHDAIDEFEKKEIAEDEETLWDLYRQDKLDELEATIDNTRLPAAGDRSKLSWQKLVDSRRDTLKKVNEGKAEKEAYDRELRDFELRARRGEKISDEELVGSVLDKTDRNHITSIMEGEEQEREAILWEDDYNAAREWIRRDLLKQKLIDGINDETRFRHLKPKDREHFVNEIEKENNAKDPNKQTDGRVLSDVMDVVLKPDVPSPTKYKVIRDNTGADEDGNPRLSDGDARTIHNFVDNATPDWYMQYVKDLFKGALDNEWIDEDEFAQLNRDFYGRIAEGDLSEEGIRQHGEHLLMRVSDEFAKKKLKETEGYSWKVGRRRQEAEIERFIEERPPETIEIPNVTFEQQQKYEMIIRDQGVLKGWDGTKWVILK